MYIVDINKISAADSFLPATFCFFPSVLESEFPLPDNIRCQIEGKIYHLPLLFAFDIGMDTI